jgi:hypothetical protein
MFLAFGRSGTLASTCSDGDLPRAVPVGRRSARRRWHIDVSVGTDTPDFMSWRANIHSKGRALLMLFLFSGWFTSAEFGLNESCDTLCSLLSVWRRAR